MGGRMRFRTVKESLSSLLGRDYVEAVVAAQARLTDRPAAGLRKIARARVDFFPVGFQRRLTDLLPWVGRPFCKPLVGSAAGAPSRGFRRAARLGAAPVAGMGYYRVGEDGRLFFTSKSEHYHVPLGHGFPGYGLLAHARRLGIASATHNNTRGHITRMLEEELVRTANGLAPGDRNGLQRVLRSGGRTALNRVINLQTGSVACEAAIKMMLARFYKFQADSPEPPCAGRTPVFLVLGSRAGRLEANYHGTAILAQTMRGMWPGLLAALGRRGIVKVATIRPNRLDDAEKVFARCRKGKDRPAGFLHELIMMNYGGLRLEERFIRGVYRLCRQHDVPTLVDEIQTCLWSPQMYMFREYGLKPTFVAVGKGLPGGEYAASRIIFNARMDDLPLFGALVTNGQEELASLSYLITMCWAQRNAEATRAVGDYFEERLHGLVQRYPRLLRGVEGRRHLSVLHFNDLAVCEAFVAVLARQGFDISAHTYKAECPPAALTKLPLIVGREAVDLLVGRMKDALAAI